jgi:hypothetical protein
MNVYGMQLGYIPDTSLCDVNPEEETMAFDLKKINEWQW